MNTQPTPARQIAFISQPVDILLVGGLSVLHLLIFISPLRDSVGQALEVIFGPVLAFFAQPFHDNPPNIYDAAVVAALLTWVINHPHFSATSHRLYRSKENMLQFPVTSLGVPVLLVFLLVASLTLPSTLGAWMVKVFLIWSPYHFSAQTLGITLLYARRAGFEITARMRKAATLFIFGTYLGPTLAIESHSEMTYYGMHIPTFGLPPDLFPLYKVLIMFAGTVCLLMLLHAAWKKRQRIPLLLLVPGFAQYMWFIGGAGTSGFQEFVPAYHSLQYLLIAWAINLKERTDEKQIMRTPGQASFESLRWFTLNIAGGIFLFYALPVLAGEAFTFDPYVAAGITVAAVQIHHFFVDGVIWKLRNPRVGQPLMTSWPELSGRTITT